MRGHLNKLLYFKGEPIIKTNLTINNLNESTYEGSRSLKDLYPEKYQEYLNSDFYKYKNSIQTEIKELSLMCKERADYRCELCGDHALDAHHIIPLEEGGPNTLDNLICVCRSCHRQIHKGVYKFDATLKKFQPFINPAHIIPDEEKPNYIQAFEDMIGTTVYKNTGGYYAFVNDIKVKYDAKAIKTAVGYIDECIQAKEEEAARIEAKKQSTKDRKVLEQYKLSFKEAGNKKMWHEMCKVIKAWDSLEEIQKQHVFETLNRFFGR